MTVPTPFHISNLVSNLSQQLAKVVEATEVASALQLRLPYYTLYLSSNEKYFFSGANIPSDCKVRFRSMHNDPTTSGMLELKMKCSDTGYVSEIELSLGLGTVLHNVELSGDTRAYARYYQFISNKGYWLSMSQTGQRPGVSTTPISLKGKVWAVGQAILFEDEASKETWSYRLDSQ